MRYALVLLMGLAAPAVSEATCPTIDPVATEAKRAPLFDSLLAASDESSGQEIASRLWRMFSTAPDTKAQDLLDKGVQRIGWGTLDEAETALTLLIDYCPDYAEGWNQRAFARFLRGDYDAALEDLDQTLTLEPRHFGALAGRGLTFLKQGRQLLAHRALRDAMAVHPWLSERHLLPPEQKI